jgi:hypothetical protein
MQALKIASSAAADAGVSLPALQLLQQLGGPAGASASAPLDPTAQLSAFAALLSAASAAETGMGLPASQTALALPELPIAPLSTATTAMAAPPLPLLPASLAAATAAGLLSFPLALPLSSAPPLPLLPQTPVLHPAAAASLAGVKRASPGPAAGANAGGGPARRQRSGSSLRGAAAAADSGSWWRQGEEGEESPDDDMEVEMEPTGTPTRRAKVRCFP